MGGHNYSEATLDILIIPYFIRAALTHTNHLVKHNQQQISPDEAYNISPCNLKQQIP